MAHPIQIILTRQLAENLNVPLFLIDPEGTLLFYNEPAEAILGQRFDETGPMTPAQWSVAFAPRDEAGQPIAADDLPLMVTLKKRRPAYRRLRLKGLDGTDHLIEAATIPISGLQNEFLGAAALFWEATD